MNKNSEKMMLQVNKKKPNYENNSNEKKNRFLITVNVVGSAGPIRFVVNEKDLVANVIDTALKSFAREGRLPVLGFQVDHFLLYSSNGVSDALSPCETIGSQGGRNFVLCKKQLKPHMTEGRSDMVASHQKGWKAWLNKSFTFKILHITENQNPARKNLQNSRTR